MSTDFTVSRRNFLKVFQLNYIRITNSNKGEKDDNVQKIQEGNPEDLSAFMIFVVICRNIDIILVKTKLRGIIL